MPKKSLSESDLAYNAIVDAINEQYSIIIAALGNYNRLAGAAENIYALKAFKQFKIESD